jgi:CRISPR-associated protein Csy3
MAKAPTAVKTASVLAFERKLATSDAVMYSGSWQGNVWQPIRIQEKAVRGTISNRLKNALTNDPAKLDAEIQKANLQRVDVAALPADADTLKVKFTLRVLGNLSTPSVCNDRAYQDELQQVIDGYIEEHGFPNWHAAMQLIWRTAVFYGVTASVLKKYVNVTGSQSWTFDAYNYALRDFSASDKDLNALAQEIEKGLSGEGFVLLNVEAQVLLGAGQEIFPSQELVLDSNSSKSRLLYQVDGVAGMHSQKIGNALRTIDTWHPRLMSWGRSPLNRMALSPAAAWPVVSRKRKWISTRCWITG